MDALFIDDKFLKDYAIPGKSLDVDEIYPFVYNAQIIYTQRVLTTPLYNSLVDKIESGATFSTIEWQLVDLVSIALAYWTTYLALPHCLIRLRNGGVSKSEGEYVKSAELSEMKYIREEMKNLAEFWDQRALDFLCANSASFPLYKTYTDGDITPAHTGYDCDLYLDNLSYDEIKFLKKYLN